MRSPFQELFLQHQGSPARAKFLARVFGIFSEEIVRIWAADAHCPYEDLGRPTVRRPEEARGSTLDFALRDKLTGKLYVAEMKCEIEYQNFRYFVLQDHRQLDHHDKPAFHALLEAAVTPERMHVTVAGGPIAIDGVILIWGAATAEGCAAVRENRHFADVLTVDDMVADLMSWRSTAYLRFLQDRRDWTIALMDGLAGA